MEQASNYEQSQIKNEKYSKEIDKSLKFEIEQLANSITFNIINSSEIIPSQFSSKYSFEEILKKDESLSSFKSINKLFLFFTKLIDKNKYKIEKKNSLYSLKFFYEDKLEDIEIEFDIKSKDLSEEEKNKNYGDSILKLSKELNDLKEEFKNFKTNYLNISWPIGSYYWTNREINPEKLFGGKWQKIEGKFLFAADDERKVDSTGGKEKVILTIEEMPSHDHEPLGGGLFATYARQSYSFQSGYYDNATYCNSCEKTSLKGGNQPHENMPPYLAAFCWKRIE